MNIKQCSTDCSLDVLIDTHELEPYNDISGIGVIIGFVGTAFFALLLLLVYYVAVHNPADETWRPNPIDAAVLRFIRCTVPVTRLTMAMRNKMEKVLFLVITGLGLLISALISIRCALSAYHFVVVTYLAWFSSVTHLVGIAIICKHFRHKPWERSVRLVMMFVLIVLLLVALIPTAFFNWGPPDPDLAKCADTSGGCSYDSWKETGAEYGLVVSPTMPSSPAICFFSANLAIQVWNIKVRQFCEIFDDTATCLADVTRDPPSIGSTPAIQSMSLSMVIMLIGFFTRVIKLFPAMSTHIYRNVRRPLSARVTSLVIYLSSRSEQGDHLPHTRSRVSTYTGNLLAVPLVAAHLVLRFHLDLFTSMLAELYQLVVLLLWGLLGVVIARSSVPRSIIAAEAQWTFGQMLSVFLLAVPVVALVFHAFSAASGDASSPPSSSANKGSLAAAAAARDVEMTPAVSDTDESSTMTSPSLDKDTARSKVTRPRLPDAGVEEGVTVESSLDGMCPAAAHKNEVHDDDEDSPSSLGAVEPYCYSASSTRQTICQIAASAGIIVTTVVVLAVSNMLPSEADLSRMSVAQLWFTDTGMAAWIAVGYPSACVVAATVGVVVDRGGEAGRGAGERKGAAEDDGRSTMWENCVFAVVVASVHAVFWVAFLVRPQGWFGGRVTGFGLAVAKFVILDLAFYVIHVVHTLVRRK